VVHFYTSAVVAVGVYSLLLHRQQIPKKKLTERRIDSKQIMPIWTPATSHRKGKITECREYSLVRSPHIECLRIKSYHHIRICHEPRFQRVCPISYCTLASERMARHSITSSQSPAHSAFSSSPHRALGSMPCGDMPSTMWKKKAPAR
jgi:hypothetical protein